MRARVSFPQHCPTAHPEEDYMEKKNPEQWRVVFPPSENNKFLPHISFSELLHNPCTRSEEIALQGGYITSKWKHFQRSSSHPCPFLACQTHRQVGQILPPPVFTAFYPKWFSSVQCRDTQFSLLWQGKMRLGARIHPGSIAFIHKAQRSLLLFGPLFFCSAHIRERWHKMLTMTTATSTGHCLNISSNFSRHFRTERLWLDLLCYSQTPWQPCSQGAQTAALLILLLEGHFGDMQRTDHRPVCREGRERYKPHNHLQEYRNSTKSSKNPSHTGIWDIF